MRAAAARRLQVAPQTIESMQSVPASLSLTDTAFFFDFDGTLVELAPTPDGALLVVGPEGGLGERDVAALRAHGFQGLQLGPRILRTETAGLAALAALQALHGDL